MKLSVLMAVWRGEPPENLRAALQSLVEQRRPADELVLVEDGPLSAELDEVVASFAQVLPLVVLALPQNRGLSHALQQGLLHCRHEWVARMDADDICLPERFARQCDYLRAHPDVDVLGSYIAEFDEESGRPYAVRTVPLTPERVMNAARWRCPLNHMTVVYRRSAILAVGGYEGFVGIEDYYLWGKLLNAHARIANLPEVLVLAQAGASLGDRRGGWRYARTEIALYRAFHSLGFMTPWQALLGCLMRLPVRLVPGRWRAWVYTRLIRSRTELASSSHWRQYVKR